MTDLTGRVLGPYRILRRMGGGGMASVYQAHDSRPGRVVALKVLAPHLWHDSESVERFRREARNAAALRHPNIVPVYDSGVIEGYPYLAMAYAEGGSLANWLDQQQGPLPFLTTAGLLDQAASALDYAHNQGVVHRDVKPSNILLTREGQVLLADFGIAKAAWDSQLTQSGVQVGTPAYMAPEQVRGRPVDRRTDIYALGVVLYQMVTGRPPFRGNTDAVLYQHVHEPPPPPRRLNPALPQAAERAIVRALDKHPARRHRTAGELAAAFRGAVAPARRSSSDYVPVPLIIVMAVLLLAGLALGLWRYHRGIPPLPPLPTIVRSPTPQAAALELVAPAQGAQDQPNPITFQWRGSLSAGQAYQVIAYHLEEGSVVQSELLTAQDWTTHLPAERYGEWRWTVSVIQEGEVVATSDEWMFWFNPVIRPPEPGGTKSPATRVTPPPERPTVWASPSPRAVVPELVAPAQGAQDQQNPITFRWRGSLSGNQVCQVTAYHPGSGERVNSGPLAATTWSTYLPADRYGEWRWTVSVVQEGEVVTTSDEWMFWFNPFPGSGPRDPQPPSSEPVSPLPTRMP